VMCVNYFHEPPANDSQQPQLKLNQR
jgi:hypothetical protein